MGWLLGLPMTWVEPDAGAIRWVGSFLLGDEEIG
jgi:hypothetical protein